LLIKFAKANLASRWIVD